MAYRRKHVLFTVVAMLLLWTAGIKSSQAEITNPEESFVLKSLKAKTHTLTNHYLLIIFSDALTNGIGTATPTKGKSDIQAQTNAANNQTTENSSQSIVVRFWQDFLKATITVKILIIILLYLLLSILVLFLSILINRQIKTRQRKKYNDLKNEYQEQLASFLFDDDVERIEFKGINKKTNRQIFIDELMDLHNNLHGEAANKLKDLYFNLSLHKDSLNKFYKGRWDKKAKGLSELSQMDVKDANDKIKEYVNSKNPILRTQAQVAMVKLAEEDPLSFLDTLESELSYWEQVNIYDALIYHQINIESFERWLDNKNHSVVIFALRMIGLFKHVSSGDKVRELLFHESSEIAHAAVKSMKQLELADYAEDLKVLYRSETLKLVNILETQRENKDEKDIKSLDDLIPRRIRFEIIDCFQAIVTTQDLPFLEQVVKEQESSYKIRLLAVKIILSIQPEGEERLNDMLKNSDDELIKKMIINVKQNQEL
jgi:hypothetical protein